MNWPVFFTRLGSAIVFAAVMMFGLLYSNPSAIFILALLIGFLCIREFFKLIALIFPESFFPEWLMWVTQVFGAVVTVSVPMMITHTPQMAIIALVFPVVLLLITGLHKKTGLIAGFSAIVALFYISMPMAFLVTLRGIYFVIPLALILMIWMNDTMAYIVGSFIGKTSFSPISPKKTWEGTAGGAILTIVGAAAWGYFAPASVKQSYSMTNWMVLALLAAVAGTAGDLLESKLKRLAGIKDSGNMMPGHGGALDRFDSLLVTLPFAFCYAALFMM